MKRVLLALATLVAFPLAAQAGDLSYNYLQAGYSYSSGDNDRHAHGWNGTASAAIGDHFQVFGGGGTSDRETADVSSETWNLGAGLHTAVSDRTDFVGDVAYHRTHIDGVGGKVQRWVGEVGVRSALAPKFEGWAMAGYGSAHNEIGDIDRGTRNQAFGKLGGQYKFTKNWGLVAEGHVASHDHGIFVGPRVSF